MATRRSTRGAAGPAWLRGEMNRLLGWKAAPGARRRLPRLGFRTIIAATDGFQGSRYVLPWAKELTQAYGGRLSVVTVAPPRSMMESFRLWSRSTPRDPRGLLRRAQRSSDHVLRDAASNLKGIAIERHVLSGDPAQAILRYAKARDADLIIVGSHGRGPVRRAWLGTVADALKNRSTASVLIARAPPQPRQVLVATDGSLPSRRAALVALDLADRWNGDLAILHAVEQPRGTGGTITPVRFAVASQPWAGPGRRRVHAQVTFGPPATSILRAARARRAGLICMGSRGLGSWRGLMAGSVSNRVAHAARTSVLLVKRMVAVDAPPGGA